MSLFDRLFSKSKREGHKAREARERENDGDLAGAVELYGEAGMGDDAARVLLLRADAEPSPEKRLAFCALAAQRAESPELRRKARGRKALLAFDTLRRSGGAFLENEVLSVARELEECGELERAADAFALGGDHDSEVRVLTAAGAIERLEERLKVSENATRSQREIEQRLRRILDLDRTAERRAALDLCSIALRERDDTRIAETARAIRARLVRGPVVDLEIDGELQRYALGGEVTIGRGDATIVIGSRAVSRRHLRLARGPEGTFVEDIDTRNGTMLAGSRIAGRLRVGDGLRLVLGGEVPCSIVPLALTPDAPTPVGPTAVEQCFAVEIAGWRYLCPLGPLPVNGWRINVEPGFSDNAPTQLGPGAPVLKVDGDEGSFVVLTSAGTAARPVLGDYELSGRVELCHGDELRAARGGRVRLRVPGTRAGAVNDETDVTHSFET